MAQMKIGELAKQSGCQVETIRYYEREGLLPIPARSAGNFRLYDLGHVERLMFIRHCRSLDMNLDEIRTLLKFRDTPSASCGEVNALLDEHIHHVSRRIEELAGLQGELKTLRRLCRTIQMTENCGIMKGLSSGMGSKRKKTGGHVRSSH
jgi:Cd(II)/Pb(II)-responsive transcriptional regulator